jgi:hypothetical protein
MCDVVDVPIISNTPRELPIIWRRKGKPEKPETKKIAQPEAT